MQALKAGDVSKAEEALTLDTWADALLGFGDANPALKMLEKARGLLKDGAQSDRLINACLR